MTRLNSLPPATSKMASRAPSPVPVPRAAPSRQASELPAATKAAPAPTQQSAAIQVKPADTPSAPAVAPAEIKPAAPVIQPTQPMPKVQDLE